MQRRASFFRSLHWAAGLWAAAMAFFAAVARVPGASPFWRWVFAALMFWMLMRLVALATPRPMNWLKTVLILGGLASFVMAFFQTTFFIHEVLIGVLLFMYIENAVAVYADPYYKAARRERGEC